MYFFEAPSLNLKCLITLCSGRFEICQPVVKYLGALFLGGYLLGGGRQYLLNYDKLLCSVQHDTRQDETISADYCVYRESSQSTKVASHIGRLHLAFL
jgi:hypothetical protein